MELHRLRPAELRQLADRRVAHSVRVLLGRRPLSAPRAPSTHAVSWCCGRDYSLQMYTRVQLCRSCMPMSGQLWGSCICRRPPRPRATGPAWRRRPWAGRCTGRSSARPCSWTGRTAPSGSPRPAVGAATAEETVEPQATASRTRSVSPPNCGPTGRGVSLPRRRPLRAGCPRDWRL